MILSEEKNRLAGLDRSEMKKRNDGYLVVDNCKEFLKVSFSSLYLSISPSSSLTNYIS
jgi:hypothetical protein